MSLKTVEQISELFILALIVMSMSQCSSVPKLQDMTPDVLEEVYYIKWAAGIRGGGSGLNLIIKTKDTSLKLDSVYFRGKAAKLVLTSEENPTYIGRYKNEQHYKDRMILDEDPKKEYGNTLPVITPKLPFNLKNDECVISYKVGSKIKYFKMTNVIEKSTLDQPM